MFRKALWDSMLDADMNARYWSYLSRRYYNYDKYSKIFLALMSSGTVASWGFWNEIQWLWKGLSSISALLAIAIPIVNWPKMISNMVALKQYWTEIKIDYEMSWLELESGKPQTEVAKYYKKTKEKETKTAVREANMPNRKKLLRKCWLEVLKSKGLNSS
jgi:hypothetical protein